MPSPERGPGGPPPERQPRSEQEPPGYYRASRFASEPSAGRAYFRVQDTILRADADLSTFRFQLTGVYHVAVLGEPPPEQVDQRLQRILASGEPVSLAPEVLQTLFQRRQQALQQGPWTEGHYRPGKPL